MIWVNFSLNSFVSDSCVKDDISCLQQSSYKFKTIDKAHNRLVCIHQYIISKLNKNHFIVIENREHSK